MKFEAMAEFIDMTSYSDNEKYLKNNYDNSKCYCGNKFIKFKVKEFNQVCCLHDHEYDVIDTIAHMIKEENVDISLQDIVEQCKPLKLLADQRFRARMRKLSTDSLRLKLFAQIGYLMVRVLKDSYPINFKSLNKQTSR